MILALFFFHHKDVRGGGAEIERNSEDNKITSSKERKDDVCYCIQISEDQD